MTMVKDEKTSKRCISCGLVKELEQFPVIYRHEIGERVKEIRSAICQSCRETDKSQKAIFLFNKFEIEEEDNRSQLLDIDYLDHLLYELKKEEKIHEREEEAKEWLNKLIEEDKKALETQNEEKDTKKEDHQNASFLSRRNFPENTPLPKDTQNSFDNLSSPLKEQAKNAQKKPKRNASRLFHEAAKSQVVHSAMKRFFANDSPTNPDATKQVKEASQSFTAQEKKAEQKTTQSEKTTTTTENSPWSPNVNPNDPRVTKLKNDQFIGSVTMARLATEKLKADSRGETLPAKPENNNKKTSTETVIRNTWRKR